jgi:hypothetical protein
VGLMMAGARQSQLAQQQPAQRQAESGGLHAAH